MGSWVRTITTPFRKMLNPQRDGKKTPRHHHPQSPSSGKYIVLSVFPIHYDLAMNNGSSWCS